MANPKPTAADGINNVLNQITSRTALIKEGRADEGHVQTLIALEMDLTNQLKFAEMELLYGPYTGW